MQFEDFWGEQVSFTQNDAVLILVWTPNEGVFLVRPEFELSEWENLVVDMM